jgi:hypothetical protein
VSGLEDRLAPDARHVQHSAKQHPGSSDGVSLPETGWM